MTVDAVRRPRRGTPAAKADSEPTIGPPASIVIGELEQTIFECPSCSRPLALGARRCPGCGTRLVRGVTLGKASGFVAAGLAVGLLSGFGGAVVLGLSHAPVAPAVAAKASAAPGTGSNGGTHATATAPAATQAATATAPSGIPSFVGSGLTQIVGSNGRLAASRAALQAALDAPAFDPSDVAQILRSVSAESIFAEQVAARLAGWSGSSAVGEQLSTFYGSVHDAAASGLVASVRNAAAYRSAAKEMVQLLGDLSAMDAAARAVAGSAGIELPTASRPSTAP